MSSNVDLAMLLYLNPELVAYSNLTNLAQAEAAWAADQGTGGAHSLSVLLYTRPNPPVGFDPKVYLAAQTDVSRLNMTIFDAMVGVGLSSNAVVRRGLYVSTLMEEVTLAYSSNSFSLLGLQLTSYEIGNEPFQFSACNLNSGDYVRMQRKTDGFGTCGEALYGQVVQVTSGSNFAFAPTSPAAFNMDPIGCVYTLSGIRIWDIERQALVAYSRNTVAFSNALSNALGMGMSNVDPTTLPGYVDSNDVVPRSDFNLDAYRSIYPDVKLLDFSDAYLDYRLRSKRSDEFRVVSGKDLFNVEAPYASNVAAVGEYGYGLTGYNATFSNNVTVNGNIGIGMNCTGSEGYSGEIDAWQARALFGSSAPSNVWFMRAGSNTRLAVAGDIFATGTVITLSDARIKSDVRPIEDALERISSLKGYTYDVPGSFKRHTGLLAQEVERVMPEAVFHRSAEGILEGSSESVASVAYGNLAGLIISAINELSERLKVVERKLLSLGLGFSTEEDGHIEK